MRDVVFSEWSTAVAITAFVVTACVFFFCLVGTLRMTRERARRDAAMPLDDNEHRQ